MEITAGPIASYQLRNYLFDRTGSWSADLHRAAPWPDSETPVIRIEDSGSRLRDVGPRPTSGDQLAAFTATANDLYESDPKHARIRLIRLLRTANLLAQYAHDRGVSMEQAMEVAMPNLPFMTNADREALLAVSTYEVGGQAQPMAA